MIVCVACEKEVKKIDKELMIGECEECGSTQHVKEMEFVMDQFKEVKSVDGNIQAYLQEKNKLKWDCVKCGKELDGDDPEGEICKNCSKQKQERQDEND